MKQVIIVAPQFPPCNLTAGHRSRYFAMHLAKFGWKVKVLSVEPRFYEEKLDYELEKLLPPDLEIIRTRACPVRPIRLIGDIGIRAFWWHYRALCRLIEKEKIDLIYIPIPPNYSAMLGPLVYHKFGIPYAIDYIDPWVNAGPGCNVLFSKGWLSYRLALILEPFALRHASLVTGVAPGYYAGALKRYAWLDPSKCLALPYGGEEEDFKYLDKYPRPPYLFNPSDGNLHIVYAGAMLPKAYFNLEALFKAILSIRAKNPPLAEKIRLHFIGTGKRPADPNSFTIKPVAEKYGLRDNVFENPGRIPYLDVLNHLKHASAILILGSSEDYYTPSKVFQAALARRPIIALLHKKSTAIEILKALNMGTVISFDEDRPVELYISEIAQAVCGAPDIKYSPAEVNRAALNAYSAEAITKKLVYAFDGLVNKKNNE